MRQQAIVRGHKHKALLGEKLRLDLDIGLIATLPAAPVNPEDDWEILRTLGNAGAVKQLIECARKESDGELKRVAVQRLGQMKSKEALDYIAELLK